MVGTNVSRTPKGEENNSDTPSRIRTFNKDFSEVEWELNQRHQIQQQIQRKPLRIAITGTHSSGKTTLAESIAREFDMKYIRGDKAIQICTSLFPNKPINELNVVEQFELQKGMFKSFDEALLTNEDVVSDGFHLTCIPYSLKYTNNEIAKLPGYQEFIHKVIEQSKKFSHIFYLPPEIKLEDDNFRPMDEMLRIDIDKTIYSLLEDFTFRTITGSVENRTKMVGVTLGRDKTRWSNYIAFEGLPRSGKSTQINMFVERAEKEGLKVYLTKRNDNEYMREVKRRLQINPYEKNEEIIELRAESLKLDFRNNNIEERLADGQIVISDRQKFTLMTLGRKMDIPRYKIYQQIYDVPDPGRTIYLDTNPMMSVTRSLVTNPHKPLKNDHIFQKEIRGFYNEFSKQHGFFTVGVNQTEDEMHKEIWNYIVGGQSPHPKGWGLRSNSQE